MFSKQTIIVVSIIVLIAVNIIVLSLTNRHYFSFGLGRFAISVIAPLQKVVTVSMRFVRDKWECYFFIVSVAKENKKLKKIIMQNSEIRNRLIELELSNKRLRSLLNFKKTFFYTVLAAEIVGRDPSPWYKTIIIDKGKDENVKKGLPVVVSEGIVGQIVEVTGNYSKVLLLVDQNSAVDSLVQRTRARGIVKGESGGRCYVKYILRKHEVMSGDVIISSGLDGVFPKGLRIGYVSKVIKYNSGIFQDVMVASYVDFEKLEEVLIVMSATKKNKFQANNKK